MDRQIVYPGAIPLETDLLNSNKYALIGLSKLAAAVLGEGDLLNGLACAPVSPAALQVQVAAGEIYSVDNVDGVAYGSLAADTVHSILKQGLLMDPVTINCPAPATAGYSVNYLVQAAYQDVDGDPVVLSYYNASNPPQAYSGPDNSGTAQATVRQGVCQVKRKTGIAATSGSQVTPAPDVGYIGLSIVTVAAGQTAITAADIQPYPGAPFIPHTLTQLAPLTSPVLTGAPTAPTPGQFDDSTQIATTEFSTRQGLHFQNAFGIPVQASTTLLATDAGHWFEVEASGLTVTLPPLASLPQGGTYTFKTFYSFTLQGNGGEQIMSSLDQIANTLGVSAGECITVTANGSGSLWYVVSAGFGTPSFASSLGAAGYQKLPSGLIIQWGSTPLSSGSGALAIIYPIAFPNACTSITLGLWDSGSATGFPTHSGNQSLTAFNYSAWADSVTRIAGYTTTYVATGY